MDLIHPLYPTPTSTPSSPTIGTSPLRRPHESPPRPRSMSFPQSPSDPQQDQARRNQTCSENLMDESFPPPSAPLRHSPSAQHPVRLGTPPPARISQTRQCLYQYIMIEGWGSAAESIHLRLASSTTCLQNTTSSVPKESHEDAVHRVVSRPPRIFRRIGLLIESRALASTRTVTLCCHLWSITWIISLTIQRRPISCPTVSRSGVELRFELDFGPEIKFRGTTSTEGDQPYLLRPLIESSNSTTISSSWTTRPPLQPLGQ